MKLRGSSLGLLLVAFLSNQSFAQESPNSYPPEVAQYLDLSVNPCEDFYRFSCGGWTSTFQLPSDAVSYYLYGDMVTEKNRAVLLKMLKSNTPIVSKYFNSCINVKRINQLAHKPLNNVLWQIDAVTTVNELVRLAGDLTMVNFNFLAEMMVSVDDKHATENVLQANQGRLTFRYNYYYLDKKIFADLEPTYRKYISTVLTKAQLAGPSNVNRLVDTIVNLEQSIAKIMWSFEDDMDPVRSYNPMTFQEASTRYPLSFQGIVSGLLAKAGVSLHAVRKLKTVIIRAPSYFEQLEKLLTTTDLAAWKILMKYLYINTKHMLLSDEFTLGAFELHGKKVEGMQERPTREKFCVDHVVKQLPNRMGKEYAALMFDTDSANLAKGMIVRIEAAMKQRLLKTDWLDESTRENALQKLAKVMNLISHSEDVEELDRVTLSADAFFSNTDAIQKSKMLQQLRKLNKPVSRGEWGVAGTEVNAYYELTSNSIVFPAGILQPPFFSKSYPEAINYGAIGSVMGHELIHAFDTSGSLYDANGNLRSWWSNKTSQEFESRTKCLSDQYSNFELVSDFDSSLVLAKVNGELSLAENIADVYGFAISLDAYLSLMEEMKTPEQTKKQQPEPEMDLSVEWYPSQQQQRQRNVERASPTKTDLEKLFYVAYAHSWCVVQRDEQAKKADRHAPPYFRVNGAMMNDPYFGKLFNCPVGSKMNPKEKCTVW